MNTFDDKLYDVVQKVEQIKESIEGENGIQSKIEKLDEIDTAINGEEGLKAQVEELKGDIPPKIYGWKGGSSGSATNKTIFFLADIVNDNIPRIFNAKIEVTNVDTSKLMGEATLIGCVYKEVITFTQCNFNYTEDKDDLVFKVGKQSNSLAIYPSFTNSGKTIKITPIGYGNRVLAASRLGDSSFEEIDVSNIDLGSKIAAIEARLSALETPTA